LVERSTRGNFRFWCALAMLDAEVGCCSGPRSATPAGSIDQVRDGLITAFVTGYKTSAAALT